MRILGVDPGLTRCGLGCVEASAARRVALVEVGVARSDPEAPPQLRLNAIYEQITEWIERLSPAAIAVERAFAHENLRSITGTAQVAGIAMLAGARAGLPVGLFSPSEVKAAVSGNGRAQKAQVQAMVTRILGLEKPPRPADAADALALAICYAWKGVGSAEAARASYGGAHTLPDTRAAGLTPAQRLWAQAERQTRRAGAVAPKK